MGGEITIICPEITCLMSAKASFQLTDTTKRASQQNEPRRAAGVVSARSAPPFGYGPQKTWLRPEPGFQAQALRAAERVESEAFPTFVRHAPAPDRHGAFDVRPNVPAPPAPTPAVTSRMDNHQR